MKYADTPTVTDAFAVAGAYAGVSLEGLPGRISIQIEKVPVSIEEKEYSHSWTIPEIPTFDFGTELVKDAIFELDTELLTLIRETAGAATPSSTFSMDKVTGTPSFVGDVHAALAILINRQANLIAARTRRGAGNKVIVSPTALTILQSATTSAFARTTNIEHADSLSLSRCKYVGMLNNHMEIYCDLYAAHNEPVVVAYKGNDTDAGIFFTVYAPFIVHNPVIVDGVKKAKLTHKTNLWALENSTNALGNGADYFGSVGIDTNTLTFI